MRLLMIFGLLALFATGTQAQENASITISVKEYERLKELEEGDKKKQYWKMTFEQILEKENNNISKAWDVYEYWVLRTVRLDGEVSGGSIESLVSEIEVLNQISAEPITLVVNSPGGSVLAGLNLVNAMESSPAPIHTVCDAWAMSMGAVIVAAGDHRTATEGCFFMIHEVAVGAPGGQTIEHIKWTDSVINVEELLVGLLAKYSGLAAPDVRALMQYETFWSGEEATRLGFFDQYVSGGRDREPRVLPDDLRPENRMKRSLADKLNRG